MTSEAEKLFPLRKVPMAGVAGGIDFVNAPLMASEVQGFKKELGNLVEDPVDIPNQAWFPWACTRNQLLSLTTANGGLMAKRRNFQLYSNIDPDGPEGQVLLKVPFVVKSWPDIRRKLEKIEDWQEKGMNEFLKEVLRVYLRREEEKAKAKARVMIAMARESVGAGKNQPKTPSREEKSKSVPPWVNPRNPVESRRCYYCGEMGHLEKDCRKLSLDEAIAREQDTLEKILRGDNSVD
ncbi:hypothetical protein HGM15179_019514 [Zosterops borbonicus]|uniref:CCHC-type domain-containing protein n=1 Tax=Zosterops borbonicus TaxID=364589 RepID=A0A8K1DBJ2_9PASS|nr:hypothetical protein HGM15179_019514 [Zosterops borbonicus]